MRTKFEKRDVLLSLSDKTMMRCSGCHVAHDAHNLDAVLLDPDGNEASSEAYCKTCHPKFTRFKHDKWSSNYGDSE